MFLSITAFAATKGFRYPDPQISVSTEPPTSDQDIYDRSKLFASQYVKEFTEQFILMNGLRENLFDVPQILSAIHESIDSQPAKELIKPETLRTNFMNLRNGLMAVADKLYAKDRPNSKYSSSSGSRIDSLESKVNDLLIMSKQNQDILRQVEELNQKVAALQQKQPAAINAPSIPKSNDRLVYAALLLAAASFFFPLVFRR